MKQKKKFSFSNNEKEWENSVNNDEEVEIKQINFENNEKNQRN